MERVPLDVRPCPCAAEARGNMSSHEEPGHTAVRFARVKARAKVRTDPDAAGDAHLEERASGVESERRLADTMRRPSARPRRVLLAITLLLVAHLGCKSGPTEKNATPPEPTPLAAPAPVDITTCPACADAAERVSFTFAGVYLDAACKHPVAQGMVEACTPAKMPGAGGTIRAMIVEPMPGVKVKGDMATIGVQRIVSADEPLFLLRGGTCSPQPAGIKRLPTECAAGGRVCRKADASGNATGTLGCSSCVLTANRCPAFEGAMAYVAVAPAP